MIKMLASIPLALIVTVAVTSAEARTRHVKLKTDPVACDRHSPTDCQSIQVAATHKKGKRLKSDPPKRHYAKAGRIGKMHETKIVANCEGSPRRAFCGYCTAKYLLGKGVREGGLAIAANWLNFPRAECAPRMAAARRGHVFAIIECLPGNRALAYDPNSGGHKTRIHVRDLARYTIVNPHGSEYEKAAPVDVEPKPMVVASAAADQPMAEAKPKAKAITGIASTFTDRRVACAPFKINPFRTEGIASKTLPCGTKVEVTNLANGRKVTTRVVDRGPCTSQHCNTKMAKRVRARIGDVLPKTAEQLGRQHPALMRISIRVLG